MVITSKTAPQSETILVPGTRCDASVSEAALVVTEHDGKRLHWCAHHFGVYQRKGLFRDAKILADRRDSLYGDPGVKGSVSH